MSALYKAWKVSDRTDASKSDSRFHRLLMCPDRHSREWAKPDSGARGESWDKEEFQGPCGTVVVTTRLSCPGVYFRVRQWGPAPHLGVLVDLPKRDENLSLHLKGEVSSQIGTCNSIGWPSLSSLSHWFPKEKGQSHLSRNLLFAIAEAPRSSGKVALVVSLSSSARWTVEILSFTHEKRIQWVWHARFISPSFSCHEVSPFYFLLPSWVLALSFGLADTRGQHNLTYLSVLPFHQ